MMRNPYRLLSIFSLARSFARSLYFLSLSLFAMHLRMNRRKAKIDSISTLIMSGLCRVILLDIIGMFW